jgi:hypothetical protein
MSQAWSEDHEPIEGTEFPQLVRDIVRGAGYARSED